MSTPRPPRTRTLGPDSSALDDESTTPSAFGRIISNVSSIRRPSFLRLKSSESALGGEPAPDKAPIPTMMQQSGEIYSTPLPKLSMIVLSIAMLAEFLSANVSAPFMLFMVKGFGVLEDDAEVALWTGLLVSTFFLTQFVTSLLWATIADKHGRRLVLVVSLLGSAITCAIFGTCTSLEQALCVRLLQGVFGGAIGVARGSVAFVTDPTNEGRAYAILGFCWGFGGVAGAIIGGTFERPADKWPQVFEKIPLFVHYPYLLPTLIAASVTLTGSILSCFLSPDGGPREGSIRLPEKSTAGGYATIPEEESEPPSPIFSDGEEQGRNGSFTRNLGKRISTKFSGYFSTPRGGGAEGVTLASSPPAPVPLSSPSLPGIPAERNRAASTYRGAGGSAYGYSGGYRNRLASDTSAMGMNRRRWSNASSMRRRRGSNFPAEEAVRESGNFAQRLLMANENAVTNMADLWVSAAMNVDNNNDDPFYDSEDEDEHYNLTGDDSAIAEDATGDIGGDIRGRGDSKSSPANKHLHPSQTASPLPSYGSPSHRPSFGSPSRPSLQYGAVRRPSGPMFPPGRKTSISFQPQLESTPQGPPQMHRRPSSVREPSIFAHAGVKTPPAVLDAQQLLFHHSSTPVEDTLDDPLGTIIEGRRVSPEPRADDLEAAMPEKEPGLMSQMPVIIIVQYGLLALHSTTHDQVFMSYLVTNYEGGGLNLNAGHFAQLIALMCLCQIAYQFYLYPNIGPPRGKFSHLAMFRLGMLLLIPAYVSVVLYRVPFASASEDGNALLMTALTISTAVRFCGNTFAYTAVSILLNYMTPPHAVGYANGIAQSIVSLARCVGPVVGGWLWSASTEGNPNGYALGFFVCAVFCALAFMHSLLIR